VKPKTVLLLVLALAGTASAVDSLNVRLIGFYLTEAERIDVTRECACILAFHVGLRLISVADPAHPYEVGQFDDTSCGFSQAIVDTDYVYLPHHPSGVRVISIADPAHPVEVGSLNTPASVGDIAVAGQHAYMTNGDELLVVSVADPVNPVIVARCDTTGTGVCNVAVSGSYAYVMDFNQGLKVISVADPLHPVEVGHCDLTGTYGYVAVSGSYVWAGGVGETFHSKIISVADPANPTVVESLPYVMTRVTMDGDTIYAPAGPQGLRIFSIKDTAHPLELGYYTGVGGAQGVALTGEYIYVADGSMLLILQYYQSGVEESSGPRVLSHGLRPTVIRSLPQGAVAFDATGRKVMNPRAGVYFLRDKERGAGGAGETRKVILQR
jgi:hypothetical protein